LKGDIIIWTIEITTEDLTLTVDQEKCIKQFVQNVRKNAKYLSNLQKDETFSVKTVFRIKTKI